MHSISIINQKQDLSHGYQQRPVVISVWVPAIMNEIFTAVPFITRQPKNRYRRKYIKNFIATSLSAKTSKLKLQVSRNLLSKSWNCKSATCTYMEIIHQQFSTIKISIWLCQMKQICVRQYAWLNIEPNESCRVLGKQQKSFQVNIRL